MDCWFVYASKKGSWARGFLHREEVMKFRTKSITAILLAFALSVFVISTAFAEGGKHRNRKSVIFTASGLVTAIDYDALSLMLDVDKANRVAKTCNGLFAVSEDVRVKTEGSGPGEFDLGLEDVEEGYYVRVFGVKQADDSCLVNRIVVWIDD